MKLRINRLLSDAGLGSRRDVEEFIRQGRVKINGQKATLVSMVDIADEVLLDDVDLPVKELVREHESLEKVASYQRQKVAGYNTRQRKGRSEERAESQRIYSAPKSAALRKTSKNNPDNKRLYKLRESTIFEDEDDGFVFSRQPKGLKRESSRHSGPRKAITRGGHKD